MQLTNSLVTICCNNVLSVTGGDIYISVMTIVSSVRQLIETPLHAMNEGASPILSYNYGAYRPKARTQSRCYTVSHSSYLYRCYMEYDYFNPGSTDRIFSSDKVLLKDAVIALKQYFAAFIFMDPQYIGQTVFKSLNKKEIRDFFSLCSARYLL